MEKADILNEIKKSKKYKGLADEAIINEINKFCKKHYLWNEYEPEFAAKQVKKRLHEAYGSFQTYKKGKREKLFNEFLKNPKNLMPLREILSTHLSARERLGHNGEIYEKLFEITGKPTSMLDLGCGLNPLAFPYMKLDKDTRYYAYDLNKEDIALVKDFFQALGINGHAETIDLKDLNKVRMLHPAEICFMLKVLDPLEKSEKGHKLAEEIIMIVTSKCNFIVASFATKTLSGKRMMHAYRGWFERMLERRGFKYTKFNTDNEVYYVINCK